VRNKTVDFSLDEGGLAPARKSFSKPFNAKVQNDEADAFLIHASASPPFVGLSDCGPSGLIQPTFVQIDLITVIASAAKQSMVQLHHRFLDCFVALLLAMTRFCRWTKLGYRTAALLALLNLH
jgi:hypothetical protein